MAPTSKRAILAVATLTLGMTLASMPAQASAPDTPGWIAQAGNGSGSTSPVTSGLDIGQVLYSPSRFAVNPGPTPHGLGKYMAWGTRTVGTARTLYVQSSDNGLNWSAPIEARLKDPNGVDAPFLLNPVGGFAVINTHYVDHTFKIFYRATDYDGTPVYSFGTAWSPNGVEWFEDAGLAQDATNTIVGGTGFKQKLVGVNSVIFNQTPSANSTALCNGSSAAPYNCAYVMHYTTEDAAGKRYSAIGRSHTGITWSGTNAPTLSPATAGNWDDHRVENMTVQRVGTSYRALYSGSQSGGRQSIGWATSTNGITFTRTLPGQATTPASTFDSVGGGNLVKAQFITVANVPHSHVYTSRTAGSTTDLWLGFTSPAPTNAPHVIIGKPDDAAVTGPKVAIEIYAGDTLGTNVGLDLGALSVKLDGIEVDGRVAENTLVGQFRGPGKKIVATATLSGGSHTLDVTIKDFDGDTTTVSRTFSVDAAAPVTNITSAPTGIEIGLVDSPGTYRANVIDPVGGLGIDYVTAVVTNPLGQTKRYGTQAAYGWQITKTNASNWTVAWVAPTLDPHFAVPGTYKVSLLGTDLGGNAEAPSAANTRMVTVI
jgi:hypothetical protein